MNLNKIALNYNNIILKHNKCIVDSRAECDISTQIAGKKITTCVIPSNMPAITNLNICKIFDQNKWAHIYPRNKGYDDIMNYITKANEENWHLVSISIGIKEDDLRIIRDARANGFRIDIITIDLALSWQSKVMDMIKFIRNKYPNIYLIVGNGDSPKWIRWLRDSKMVNCAKINIGTSKACRTKEFTGFASSTITDLESCYVAANDELKILSDGGLGFCETGEVAIGDCAKAIRFGADFILSGALFSQCIDSPTMKNGYYGNSTHHAKGYESHIEGALINVQTNGMSIFEIMIRIEESLKSSVSYSGGNKLTDIRNSDYQIIL